MPRWKELKRFCDKDGWELYKNTDHYYYRKIDENGIRMDQLWRTNDEAGAFRWVLVNLAISTVVLLAVNLLEQRQKAVRK